MAQGRASVACTRLLRQFVDSMLEFRAEYELRDARLRGTPRHPGGNAGTPTTTALNYLSPAEAKIGNRHGACSSSSPSCSPEAPAASSRGEQCRYPLSCLSSPAVSCCNLNNVSTEPTPIERADKARQREVALKYLNFDTSNTPPLEHYHWYYG